MIKKYALLFAILLLIITSCSRGNEIIEPEIEQNSNNSFKYIAGYMFYEGNFDASSKITVDFINSKPIKRTIPANDPSTIGGSTNINDGSLYEELSYNGNTITILQKSSNPTIISPEYKKIITINAGKIIKKIVYDQFNEKLTETDYIYNDDKLQSFSYFKKFYTGMMYLDSKSIVYYNGNNNVDSIVTKKSEYDNNLDLYVFNDNTLKRKVETFTNFDASSNPLKNLGVFDQLFYRSLSANNFKNYELKSYDENGSPNGATAQINWTFVYEDGQINFAKQKLKKVLKIKIGNYEA